MSAADRKPPRPGYSHLRVVDGSASVDERLDFDSMFRRYSPYVASVGVRLLGRDDEVDDLIQDVFLEAHRGLSSVRDPGAIKGWLARICVRRAVRRLRRRKLRAWLSFESLVYEPASAAIDASPETRAEVTRLYYELEKLPALVRAAWVLRHLEGQSLDDIAAACTCSKSTVQRRLRSADAVLRAIGSVAAGVVNEP
ncbi:MAG TPA: sigma-70 family RNA polymerase sigma factor [Polyangiaceae bacterium]|jgi:RNA polymerase sigma-70 factor (ECF subfamily)|nr:sigma-70 family RNA polymerase sigma factor [Polyangiaceae bacterium]